MLSINSGISHSSQNSIRGHLDGFIRAFDKHFNLLMFDVDEEYITNKVRLAIKN